MRIVEAIARVSLLHAAHREPGEAYFSSFGIEAVYDSARAELAGDSYDFPGSPSAAQHRIHADTVDLAEVMSIHNADTELFMTHKNGVLDQVRSGVRSPSDAHSEFVQLTEDRRLLRDASYQRYDKDGLRLSNPTNREGGREEKRTPTLSLRRVTRSDSRKYIDPESKAALFSQVEEGSKARSVDVVPIRKGRYGDIDTRRPFVGDKMMVHRTYGYTRPGSGEFVPVLTKLSNEHPALKAK
ncbi:MAG TPA: hypothetical protein VMR34_02130 [Candidatus Saccharimonadales bacterium]|nr:hypothetical protein [Candidatus Saccharimonadales bacterium]